MEDLKIIYYDTTDYKRPKGIRNKGGFLLLFPYITHYQDERFIQELNEQNELANYLLNKLKEEK